MDKDLFFILLGAIGSIASLIALLLSLTKGRQFLIYNSFALLLIFLLTGVSSYFSYQFYLVTQSEKKLHLDMENAQKYSENFIGQYPEKLSIINKGQNEGIIKSGLVILEMFKRLYPETYETVKKDIAKDMEFVRTNRGSSGENEALYRAAQSVYQQVKALSGK